MMYSCKLNCITFDDIKQNIKAVQHKIEISNDHKWGYWIGGSKNIAANDITKIVTSSISIRVCKTLLNFSSSLNFTLIKNLNMTQYEIVIQK